MNVYSMRGLPGSGKSTWVKNFIENHQNDNNYVCSADKWLIKDGIYQFNAAELGEAHRQCMRNYMQHIILIATNEEERNTKSGRDSNIFVDNTNINLEDISPYIRIAEAGDANVRIVECKIDVKTAMERNIHSVPAHSIQRMSENFKPLPKCFQQYVI